MITRTVAVSLLNPHAILDTVGVIGAAIAAQPDDLRVAFATGTVTASWLWFVLLVVVAGVARNAMTPRRRLWFDRASAVVLLAFGAGLAVEFVREPSEGAS